MAVRMIVVLRSIALPFIFAIVLAASWALGQGAPEFEDSEIVIETASGEHRFRVEIARTREQLSHGLMFRRRLAEDAGMLFDYTPPQRVSMWMRNTLISLDMLFIAPNGSILRIEERTVPMSLRQIGSEAPVRGVLEVNGGTASRLGIRRGDRVRHEIFGTAR